MNIPEALQWAELSCAVPLMGFVACEHVRKSAHSAQGGCRLGLCLCVPVSTSSEHSIVPWAPGDRPRQFGN